MGCKQANQTSFKKGQIPYNKGKQLSTQQREKISKSHLGKIGKKASNWKGGRVIDKNGYVLIYKHKHPFSNIRGYIYEHRLVMEKFLGRYLLPKEVVHHINHIRSDNRIENLMLFPNDSEHKKYQYAITKKLLKYLPLLQDQTLN